ncbi:MAG: hypothetical protein ABR583_00225 [Gaiellaceae bacterium]
MSAAPRPAFYALAPGGWRDYVTLLHPPYTLWHLSYVALGAGLAPGFELERLGAGLVAFLFAVGIGAHALDELQGRPLATRIPANMLRGLAAASILAAIAVGVVSALAWTLWLLPLVAFGGFIVVAYNLELFGGRFHGDVWFGLSWGAFPLLAGYLVCAERIDVEAVAAAGAAFLLTLAQRVLSTQVRTVRRRLRAVTGTAEYDDGRRELLDASSLTAAPEAALRLLSGAIPVLALAVVLVRV